MFVNQTSMLIWNLCGATTFAGSVCFFYSPFLLIFILGITLIFTDIHFYWYSYFLFWILTLSIKCLTQSQCFRHSNTSLTIWCLELIETASPRKMKIQWHLSPQKKGNHFFLQPQSNYPHSSNQSYLVNVSPSCFRSDLSSEQRSYVSLRVCVDLDQIGLILIIIMVPYNTPTGSVDNIK